MNITIQITLTTSGNNTGPFDLYTNLDLITPFATNVSKAALLAGYVAVIDDSASYVRIQNIGDCTNYIDVNLNCPSATPTCTITITPTNTPTATLTPTPSLTPNLPGIAYEVFTGTTMNQAADAWYTNDLTKVVTLYLSATTIGGLVDANLSEGNRLYNWIYYGRLGLKFYSDPYCTQPYLYESSPTFPDFVFFMYKGWWVQIFDKNSGANASETILWGQTNSTGRQVLKVLTGTSINNVCNSIGEEMWVVGRQWSCVGAGSCISAFMTERNIWNVYITTVSTTNSLTQFAFSLENPYLNNVNQGFSNVFSATTYLYLYDPYFYRPNVEAGEPYPIMSAYTNPQNVGYQTVFEITGNSGSQLSNIAYLCGATPVPTRTPTVTPTITKTSSQTPSLTSSPTLTPTVTPTLTQTSTPSQAP